MPILDITFFSPLPIALTKFLQAFFASTSAPSSFASARSCSVCDREVRVHRFGAVAAEQREVMHLTRRAGLDDEAGRGAQALVDEVLVDRRQREQRGDRELVAVHAAVGEDEDRVAGAHRVFGLRRKAREARFDRFLAPRERVGDVELERLELAVGVALDVADRLHLLEIEHRLRHFEAQRRVHLVDAEQVRASAR